MVVVYVLRRGAAMRVSRGMEYIPHTFRERLRHAPFVLRCCALAAIVVALARPQTTTTHDATSKAEGIDIAFAIDISGSMLARDFSPDRMEAAKETASRFISARPNDRMALVVFAGESFTQSPLTTDRNTLQGLLAGIHVGMVEDGTAIGNGLATAINRLRDSEAVSRVIVLLTDGVNNSGQIAPMTAAEIAKTFGIRVYTIGVGTRGTAPSPAYDAMGRLVFVDAPVEIDEEMLSEIAAMTGGEYFRATDNNSLQNIYAKIDTLERSKIEVEGGIERHELFALWALIALACLVLEFLVDRILIRRLP